MKNLKTILATVSVVVLLSAGFFFGYTTYPKLKPCPEIITDTVFVYDTTWHTISDSMSVVINNLENEIKYWKARRDTIKIPGQVVHIPADIDTAAILKDYYSVYKYGWEKTDSVISIVDSVIVTQNVPIYHSIKYKINKPFVTIENNIDNSITYNKYLQLGASVPIYNYKLGQFSPDYFKYMSFRLSYVFPKGYMSVDIQPSLGYIGLGVGSTVYKFKNK